MQIPDKWLEMFRLFLSNHVEILDEEFDSIKSILEPVTLKKGDLFVGHNREKVRCGFIIEGMLRTYFITEKGDEFTTDFCKENDITTNYDSLTNTVGQEYYSEALEPTIILAMENQRFLGLADIYPSFKFLKSNLVEYYCTEKISREKDLLSLDAKDKYLRFLKVYKDIIPRIAQYHILHILALHRLL